jgi:hypothetical protein
MLIKALSSAVTTMIIPMMTMSFLSLETTLLLFSKKILMKVILVMLLSTIPMRNLVHVLLVIRCFTGAAVVMRMTMILTSTMRTSRRKKLQFWPIFMSFMKRLIFPVHPMMLPTFFLLTCAAASGPPCMRTMKY